VPRREDVAKLAQRLQGVAVSGLNACRGDARDPVEIAVADDAGERAGLVEQA
jgi:hypothetical protein